jgi:hypothetical protein
VGDTLRPAGADVPEASRGRLVQEEYEQRETVLVVGLARHCCFAWPAMKGGDRGAHNAEEQIAFANMNCLCFFWRGSEEIEFLLKNACLSVLCALFSDGEIKLFALFVHVVLRFHARQYIT